MRTFLAGVVLASLVLLGFSGSPAQAATPRDPAYHVPKADLRAALHGPSTFHSTRQPVLLVHGTFTHGQENYGWNYLPELAARGFDACYVDLPNRSLDDIQLSSEYVV